jgi:hypothetical protein
MKGGVSAWECQKVPVLAHFMFEHSTCPAWTGLFEVRFVLNKIVGVEPES